MSRTLRRPRPKYHGKALGRIRDGERQRFDTHCRHHGPCDYCANGRTHASRRRAPIVEANYGD